MEQAAIKATAHKKSKMVFLLKLSVSAGLIIYLVWLVDWTRVIKILGNADKLFLVIIPLFLFTRLCFAALRWQVILADSQVKLTFWQAYAGYLAGAFYNIFLPGVTGGDVVRIGRCIKRTNCRLGTATASVLMERISGVIALVSIALSTYVIFPATLSSLWMVDAQSSVKIGAAIVIGLLVAITLSRRQWLQWLPQKDDHPVWRFILSGVRTFCLLRGQTLVLVLLLSIVFQAMDIVIMFLISQMIRLNVPLTAFFAAVPLVYLAVMVPVSLGGLGIREGSMAFLLAQFGVATSDAVTLSFLVYLSYFITAGTGGIVQLVEIALKKGTAPRTAI